jgi:hypothetical protein
MDKRYFVIDNTGQQYGPADLATLQQWWTEGRLLPGTHLRDETTGQFVLVSQVPGLISATPVQEQSFQHNPYEHGPRQSAGYYRGDVGFRIDATKQIVMAALSTAFCCVPVGIAALVYALKANNNRHDAAEAQRQQNLSSLLSYIAIGLGAVYFALSLLGLVVYPFFD